MDLFWKNPISCKLASHEISCSKSELYLDVQKKILDTVFVEVLYIKKHCFFQTGKDVIKITYQDKIRLTALWKQVSVGKYDPSKIPEVGYFDVVGNDRK